MRTDYGERRFVILYPLAGRLIHVTYTMRGRNRRIISARKANSESIGSMSATEMLRRAVLTTDGRALVEQPDGSYRPAQGKTDWAKVDRTSEAELDAAVAADRDDPGNVPDFWDRAHLVFAKKERVTLRLDADVLDWFRRQGRGYQAGINAILRRHFEHARNRSRP